MPVCCDACACARFAVTFMFVVIIVAVLVMFICYGTCACLGGLLPHLCLCSFAVTLMLVLLICYGTLACHVHPLRCLCMLCSFAATLVLVCCNAHACRNHLLRSCCACFVVRVFLWRFFLSCLFTVTLVLVVPVVALLMLVAFLGGNARVCHARLLQCPHFTASSLGS